MSELGQQDDGKTMQYLTFTLRDEAFAIDINKVREVMDVSELTRIPRMPAYICGVLNLRGSVVPVMDLGHRLGMAPVEFAKETCVMIMETEIEGTAVAMGTLADSVQMVVDLRPSEIEPVPRMGANISTDFITGMGRQGDKFLILLNIDMVLASEDTELLAQIPLGMEALMAAESANNAAAVEQGT